MNLSQKIPVGYGTIAGTVLALGQIAAGAALVLWGKSAVEKETGKQLLTISVPVVGAAVVGGRMLQGAAQVHGEAQLPTEEDELAAPPPEIPASALQSEPVAVVAPPVAPAEIPAA